MMIPTDSAMTLYESHKISRGPEHVRYVADLREKTLTVLGYDTDRGQKHELPVRKYDLTTGGAVFHDREWNGSKLLSILEPEIEGDVRRLKERLAAS